MSSECCTRRKFETTERYHCLSCLALFVKTEKPLSCNEFKLHCTHTDVQSRRRRGFIPYICDTCADKLEQDEDRLHELLRN